MANSWDSIFQGIGQLGATKARGWDKVIGGSSRLADTFKQIKERKDMFGQQTSEREASQSFQENQSWLDRNLQQNIAEMDDSTRKQLASEAQAHAESLQNRLMDFQTTELDRQLTHSERMEKERTALMLAEFKEVERRFNITHGQNQERIDAENQPDFQTALSGALLPFAQSGKFSQVTNEWMGLPLSGSDVDTIRDGFNSQFKDGAPPKHMGDALEAYIAGLGGPGGIPDNMGGSRTVVPEPDSDYNKITDINKKVVEIRDAFLDLKDEPNVGTGMKADIDKVIDQLKQTGDVLGYTPGIVAQYQNILDKYKALIDSVNNSETGARGTTPRSTSNTRTF